LERHVRTLALLLTLISTSPLFAQQQKLQILPAESEPRKMLYQFLLKEAQQHFDARRQAIARLKTPEEIRQRQADLKARFLAALGSLPEKTPLNARVVGTVRGEGFRVEKVIYESRPEHHVTANLYVPDGQGPFPGVLLPCGHSDNGKAAEAYQRAAILLAKHGFVVLCFDPIGQGERAQLLDANHKPGIKGSTTEHTLTGIGALLVGQSTATYRIWDGIRSLDYLASRPEVDAKRLGCTGNSGGGTETAYLMALDERIACAVPSCYITSLERLFATIGPQDAEQNITGQVAFGMEHADYITLRAPRPTLIGTATQDFFDIQGSWTTFREVSRIYAKLGHGERVALFEYDDKHGFSKPRREATLRWLRRWLQGIDDAPSETSFPTFTDAELQCTRSGQVLEDLKGRSVFQMNVQTAKELALQRAKFLELPEAQRQEKIRQLLGLPATIPLADWRKLTPAKSGQRLAASTTEPGITLPALLYGDTHRLAPREATIYLSDRELQEEAQPGGTLDRLAPRADGACLIALSVRGLGETAPSPRGQKPSYFGSTFKESFLGLHLNRPLLGQRVRDVLAVIAGLPRETQVHVIGVGEAGPVALHVAALEPRVKRVTLEGSVLSWSNVVQTPISYGQLANVVPGVLQVYDLPDLAATLAPRALTIRNPVDATQRPVSEAELYAAYEVCRSAYEREKAAKQLQLSVSR
jgi:cephalosporin-C deacetylase-like acetyl esterase